MRNEPSPEARPSNLAAHGRRDILLGIAAGAAAAVPVGIAGSAKAQTPAPSAVNGATGVAASTHDRRQLGSLEVSASASGV
jgi:hypothetical protein